MESCISKYMAFIKTVECGSFTRAAKLLNYSQSGISRMIADLESEWRVTLLERGRGGVRITSDGLRLLPFAQNVCEEYRKLHMQVDDLNGLRSGLIRIGTFSSVATHWLPKIIKSFRADFPNIDFELLLGDYTEISRWITEGRVDCAFTRMTKNPPFQTRFLEHDELLAVLPPDHPLAKLESVPVSGLCSYPFIMLERGARSEVYEFFEQQGATPDVRVTTWDDYAVMSMVENGLGIALLPQLILRRAPYRICTKRLSAQAGRDICFALRDENSAPLAVQRFAEYLDHRNDENDLDKEMEK